MRSMRASPATGLSCMLGLALVAAACGGGGGDEAGDGRFTTSVGPDAVPTTSVVPEAASGTSVAPVSTAAPVTFREALLVRFTDELDDAALAAEVVGQLDDAAAARLDDAVGGDAADPLFSYTPSTVTGEQVDSVVVFAFGNRLDGEGNPSPGPTNEALAETTAAFVSEHRVPVYAQWEVAEILVAEGVPGVVSIDPGVDPSGQPVYLSTAGVAQKAVELAEADEVDVGHVGIIAFRDHAVRSIMTARDAGMIADVPDGVMLPAVYDADSGQPWTRDRASFIAADLAGRLLAEG